MTGDEMVPIRIAARLLGVHPNTLRSWEKQGVIQAARTISGHRRYSRAEIARVQADMNNPTNKNTPEPRKPEGE